MQEITSLLAREIVAVKEEGRSSRFPGPYHGKKGFPRRVPTINVRTGRGAQVPNQAVNRCIDRCRGPLAGLPGAKQLKRTERYDKIFWRNDARI